MFSKCNNVDGTNKIVNSGLGQFFVSLLAAIKNFIEIKKNFALTRKIKN